MSDLKVIIEKAEKYFEDGFFVDACEYYKKAYREDKESFTIELKEHFAMSIYESDIRGAGFLSDKLDSELIFITNLLDQKDTRNGEYDIYTESVMTVIQFNNDFDAILRWYKKLDPKILSPILLKNNSYSYRDKYYSNVTRALLGKKEYKKCIALCNEALSNIDEIMNDDENWFVIRLARSHAALGNYELAIKYFKEAIKHKVNWHNKHRFAECYYAYGDLDMALKTAIDAVLTEPKVKPYQKKNLYKFMKVLFDEKGLVKESDDISQLIYSIRFNSTSTVIDEDDEDYLDFLEQLEDDSHIDVEKIEKELKKDWKRVYLNI